MLAGGGEEVRDSATGQPVAYLQTSTGGGAARVLLPDGRGGWAGRRSDPVTIQAWLAGANKAHDAAAVLHNIAARSGPQVPDPDKLTSADTAALR